MLNSDTQKAVYKRLGEIIKEFRLKKEVKQDLLADFTGLSRISIVNIEQGTQKVQIHTLLEIAKYLQIPVAEFLDPLYDFLSTEIDSKLEKRIDKERDKGNTEDLNKIKEFISFTISKNKK